MKHYWRSALYPSPFRDTNQVRDQDEIDNTSLFCIEGLRRLHLPVHQQRHYRPHQPL